MNGRWLVALVVVVLTFSAPVASAQVPPVLTINDAADFEGNAGVRALTFPVSLSAPSSTAVTAQFMAIPLSGATGGAACTAGVDFVQQQGVAFTIPANVTTTSVTVTICGDTTIEPMETIFVALTNVVGAQCFEGTCNGVGAIRNDDGPPTVSINNISPFEPLVGTRTGLFTVSLSHPSQSATTVNFATRDGTARGAAGCAPFITGGFPDYVSRSGQLSIPANTLTGTISVTICADNATDPGQTFFMDLSAPAPAGVTITDSVGQATIREVGFVGEFELQPQDARVRAGEELRYTVVWTVPDGQVWRDVHTIDLRIRGGKTAMWVRWDETTNAFSLCRTRRGDDDDDEDERGSPVQCGPGAVPGSGVVLETSLAQLNVADSTVVGSGPTGTSVTLELAITFKANAAGHSYRVELAAEGDSGSEDDFQRAGTVEVERVRRRD